MKPVPKPQTHEKYEWLIDTAAAAGPVLTAVAHPCDEVSLKGAVEAARLICSIRSSLDRLRGSRISRNSMKSISTVSGP